MLPFPRGWYGEDWAKASAKLSGRKFKEPRGRAASGLSTTVRYDYDITIGREDVTMHNESLYTPP